jgi:hypothetical protein
MKAAALILCLCCPLAHAKDKSNSYQMGVLVDSHGVSDGTITDTFDCGDRLLGKTTCSGGVYANSVTLYRIKVAGGIWVIETRQQALDSAMRRLIDEEPTHFKAEKKNPLDFMKYGDRVLFRVETHRKLVRTETDIYIPYADKPDKEASFVGHLESDAPTSAPVPKSDNVKAMCDAHKLSPQLEAQLCKAAR